MPLTLRGLIRGFAVLAVLQSAAPAGASSPISETTCHLSGTSIERITADSTGDSAHHVRSANRRVQEALKYGLAKSESFRDLIATLDFADRIVYVEEGSCANPEHRSCLHLLAGSRHLIVHISPRQEIGTVVAQLAHELYHAAEIGREPSVTNAAELQAL
jgi:protein-tyrosine-phosphatase